MLIVLQNWGHIYMHDSDELVIRFFDISTHVAIPKCRPISHLIYMNLTSYAGRLPTNCPPPHPRPRTIGREAKERERRHHLNSEADLAGRFPRWVRGGKWEALPSQARLPGTCTWGGSILLSECDARVYRQEFHLRLIAVLHSTLTLQPYVRCDRYHWTPLLLSVLCLPHQNTGRSCHQKWAQDNPHTELQILQLLIQ